MASLNLVTFPSGHEGPILPTLPLASPGNRRQQGKGRRRVITQTWLRGERYAASCVAPTGGVTSAEEGKCQHGVAWLRETAGADLRLESQGRTRSGTWVGAIVTSHHPLGREHPPPAVRQKEGVMGKEANVPEGT